MEREGGVRGLNERNFFLSFVTSYQRKVRTFNIKLSYMEVPRFSCLS